MAVGSPSWPKEEAVGLEGRAADSRGGTPAGCRRQCLGCSAQRSSCLQRSPAGTSCQAQLTVAGEAAGNEANLGPAAQPLPWTV